MKLIMTYFCSPSDSRHVLKSALASSEAASTPKATANEQIVVRFFLRICESFSENNHTILVPDFSYKIEHIGTNLKDPRKRFELRLT